MKNFVVGIFSLILVAIVAASLYLIVLGNDIEVKRMGMALLSGTVVFMWLFGYDMLKGLLK